MELEQSWASKILGKALAIYTVFIIEDLQTRIFPKPYKAWTCLLPSRFHSYMSLAQGHRVVCMGEKRGVAFFIYKELLKGQNEVNKNSVSGSFMLVFETTSHYAAIQVGLDLICSPGWSWTHGPSACIFQVLELQYVPSHSASFIFFKSMFLKSQSWHLRASPFPTSKPGGHNASTPSSSQTYTDSEVSPVHFCYHNIVILPVLQSVIVWVLWDSTSAAERKRNKILEKSNLIFK